MISAMAEITGLTPRAIRLYDEMGLVETTRDFRNQRRFGAKARADLLLIATLRRAGLGLRAIQEVLDLDVEGAFAKQCAAREKLLEAKGRLEQQMASLEAALEALDGGRADVRPTGATSVERFTTKHS